MLASQKENRERSAIDISEHEVQNDSYDYSVTNDSVVVFEDDADSMNEKESVDEEAIEEEFPPSKYVPYYFSMTSSDEEASEDDELLEELELASSFSLCFELMEENDDVDDEIIDEEASEEEEPLEDLSHMTLECFTHDVIETNEEIDEVNDKVVQHEVSYFVEPELIDFIFAPNSFDNNDRVNLLSFLPKIFSVGKCSRSRWDSTFYPIVSERVLTYLYNHNPVRRHIYVRGWSLILLKWLWKYKGRPMFKKCVGIVIGNQRCYSFLLVFK